MATTISCDVCGASDNVKHFNFRVQGFYPIGFKGPANVVRDLCPQHSEEAGRRLTELWEAIGVATNVK